MLKNTFKTNFNHITILFFLLFLVTPKMVFGQEKKVIKGNQVWLQYYNQTKLNDNWTLVVDGGYRWRDGFQDPSQYIVRAGMGYNFKPDIRISAGLAHLGFYRFEKINMMEFRPYQEFLYRKKYQKFGLNHRFRIEERFFYPVINGDIQSSPLFNFRFRYSLMASIPLFKLSKVKPDKEFLLNIGDELFINAGEDANAVFDQNRFIVSPSFKLSENLTLSLTWNSQYGSTAAQNIYSYNNVFWLQINHRLDITKKQKE